MQHYNLITLGDLSTTSDVEGRTFIGGNFTATNSATFAAHLGGAPAAERRSRWSALVAGNPINLQAGSLRIKGSTNGRIINFNGGGSTVPDPSLSNGPLTATLQGAAAQLAAVAANNAVTLPSGQPGAARFAVSQVNPCGIAVFSVAAGDLFGNALVQQIELTRATRRPSSSTSPAPA